MIDFMLHDGVMSKQAQGTECTDRRKSDRVPFPAELVLRWMHDMDTSLRLRVIDAGDGGFRIRSATPVTEGMTGIAVKLLPTGEPINQPVMVVWVGPPDENGERDLGLRYF